MTVNQKFIISVEPTYICETDSYSDEYTDEELTCIAEKIFSYCEIKKNAWTFNHSEFGEWHSYTTSLNGSSRPPRVILESLKELSKNIDDITLRLYILEEYNYVHVSVTNALNGIITRENFFRMPLFTDLVVKYDLSPYIKNLCYPLVKSASSK
jgi:hypothetical protein